MAQFGVGRVSTRAGKDYVHRADPAREDTRPTPAWQIEPLPNFGTNIANPFLHHDPNLKRTKQNRLSNAGSERRVME